jgi:GAF domain-containing protein
MQNNTEQQTYNLLYKQIDSITDKNDPVITNLANITAALKQTFAKISWVGFYLLKKEKLFLGPFQGNVACTEINIGKGVCGKSFETTKTLIVPDVHKFPGYIACEIETNSEIVIPIFYNKEPVGVLDLDSNDFAAYDEIDKQGLEKICKLISTKLDLRNII